MWQGVTQTKGAPNTESNRTILGTICSVSTENNMGPRPLQTSSSNSNGKSMNNKGTQTPTPECTCILKNRYIQKLYKNCKSTEGQS